MDTESLKNKARGVFFAAAVVLGGGSGDLQSQESNQDIKLETQIELQEALFVFENENLRIQESPLPGIIDLFRKAENGEWIQYNNLAPIARVNGVWNNAEIEKADIEIESLPELNSKKSLRLKYSRFSNGAHFSLVMTMDEKTPEVTVEVEMRDDSLQIEAFSVANYFGLADNVQKILIDGKEYGPENFSPPVDDHFEMGSFHEIPTENNIVEFIGESGIIQMQSVSSTKLLPATIEIRSVPWLPEHGEKRDSWFETIHFTSTLDSIWTFSYEDVSHFNFKAIVPNVTMD